MESERSELAELNKMKEFEILNELKIESPCNNCSAALLSHHLQGATRASQPRERN